jgi:hypothetical protein
MHAAGGPDAFLAEHAVIVVADHAHTPVERSIDLFGELHAFDQAGPSRSSVVDAEIAVCPAQRSAMVYVLVPEGRAALVPRLVETCQRIEGVELVMHREDGVAIVLGRDGALAFAPGEEVRDARGREWVVRGDLAVLDARIEDGVFVSDTYPDALARVWAALDCPTSGDVLLSAAPGYEFVDWGGVDHVGGGSHGSLRRDDSLGALIMAGVEPGGRPPGWQWSIRDVAAMVCAHFGVPSPR